MGKRDGQDAPSSGDRTRAALIEAGLKLFGEKGFAATSTREIAARANANIGSIAYHFGGKEKLRDACAGHIVATIRTIADPVLERLPVPADPATAEAQFRLAAERMAGFMIAGPEVQDFVQFILREVQQPTRAFDIIYEGLIEAVHRRLCHVWAAATGDDPDSEATSIMVFTVIGQIVYFRIAREVVMRRMGWREIGPAQARLIVTTALDNVMAALSARRERKP
ncbi:MAG: DUF1956 domain-containing protein [Hyphomicrobiales bacterium]|nr:MAG: DUF1956 domain-containing protein [Hyphomicrobiales bacterium]